MSLTEKQLRAALAAILAEEETPSSAEVLASRTTWGDSGWNDPMLPKDHAPSANRTSMAAEVARQQRGEGS